MPISLSTALPVAAASLAYLNAKYSVGEDLWAIKSALGHQSFMPSLEKADRVNMFYDFEALAKGAQTGRRLFLVVPQDPAQPYAKTEWTYAEAYTTVLRVARWLREAHRVQKNEIIAMDFKNKPEFVWVWFALWSLGAVPAFINSNLRDAAFVHCVKISTSRLLLLDHEIQDVLTEETRKALSAADEKGHAREVCVVDPYTLAGIARLEPYRAPNEARSGALIRSPAILIYTSGTTGELVDACNDRSGENLLTDPISSRPPEGCQRQLGQADLRHALLL